VVRAAFYGRFSTDNQRDESIEDQFRECERVAKAEAFEVVARFDDMGISGGTATRPGYQALLSAARAGQFEVIITEDISRLWRNRAEFGPRSAELEDLGIHWVSCVGQDTRRDGWGLVIQILQAMAEHQRRETSFKTRRGLEGLARAGKPTGRCTYGYIPAKRSATHEFEIDPDQATVVVRIFKLYADGYSPRAIADILNKEGIPTARAKSRGWRGSTIKGVSGDSGERNAGILNNELYRGNVQWGRSRWPRSAADSSVRTVKHVPKIEWVERTNENLRIVSEELWALAEQRKQSIKKTIGRRIREGISKAAANRTGAGPKYLFSGLLQCSQCGSNYVICGRDVYGCAGQTNGGIAICSNDARVRRHILEEDALRGIKAQLLLPEWIDEITRQVRVLLQKPRVAPRNLQGQIKELRAQVDNMTDAIATGLMRASPALGARLSAAEDELARLERTQQENEAAAQAPERVLVDLTERVTQAVGSLQETLAHGDIAKSRQEIKEHIGTIKVEADRQEIRLYTDKMHLFSRLLRAQNGHANLCGSGGLLLIQASRICQSIVLQ